MQMANICLKDLKNYKKVLKGGQMIKIFMRLQGQVPITYLNNEL